MKKNIRIVFMGTPHFAVAPLQALVASPFRVVGVVTAPDKPAGRGREFRQSAVKEYALSQDLTVLQPTNLKETTFLTQLEALSANLFVVVAFRMLPKLVWQMPPLGTFNLHASLLPQYRGAAPINWVIIKGEEKTGVTTFFIDEKIDTGVLIAQEELRIEPEDNAGSLHDKLMLLGSRLVVHTVEQIAAGTVVPQPQPEQPQLHDAPKLHNDNTRIDWSDSLRNIHNKIRGLSPYPAAWCYLRNGTDELKVKIYAAHSNPGKHKEAPGTIHVTKKEVKVAVKGGYLYIEEWQLPGKKRMEVAAFLNGFSFEKGAMLC